MALGANSEGERGGADVGGDLLDGVDVENTPVFYLQNRGSSCSKLALGVKREREEGGAEVDDGLLDDLGVVSSKLQNVAVWMEELATRYVTCAPDGKTDQPLTD